MKDAKKHSVVSLFVEIVEGLYFQVINGLMSEKVDICYQTRR